MLSENSGGEHRVCTRRFCAAVAVPLLALMLAWTARAHELPVLEIHELHHLTLQAPAQFHVADRESTLESVRTAPFAPLTPADLNQGISDRAYWLRVRLSNPAPRDQSWVLHHETPYIDNLAIFHADNDGLMRSRFLSDRAPFADRPLNYRKLGFRHSTPAEGHTDLYLRLDYDKADSVSLTFHLRSEEAFLAAVQNENLVQGVYFGVMLTLLFLAALLAVVLRQRIFLCYAAFLLISTLMWAKLTGFAYQYLWPNSIYLHNEGFHIVFLLVVITALQFSKAFLETARIAPRADRLLAALQVLMWGGIALRAAGVYEPVLALSYTGLSLLGLLPLLGFHAWRHGLRYARWFAVAWLVYSCGLILSVISASSSLLPWGMQSLFYAQMAGLLEALLLFAALGERLMGWDRDRQSALRMAQHDPLTGLGNRRVLDAAFERFRARSARTGVPAHLAIFDLDCFKGINDTFGHDAGDAVLRQMAQLLRGLKRSEDVCIRLGGDELALLFEAPTTEAAFEIVERVRTEFEKRPTRCRGRAIRHTVSAGLAEAFAPDAAAELDELIARADSALYRSKAGGRNRTISFSPAALRYRTADGRRAAAPGG